MHEHPAPAKTSDPFFRFLHANQDKMGGILLLLATIVSLAIANSPAGDAYLHFWHRQVAGGSIEFWVNDALMAIFFLFVGLELEHELYSGELSNPRKALLPIVAACGGIAVPALIHFSLNAGTPTQAGLGIPMATDIAFALGVLALLGDKVPVSLKIFLTALAVMDDLGAIVVIALFYTAQIDLPYLAAAAGMFAILVLLNRVGRVMSLAPYLLGGALLWFFMLKSGVHATISGVLLAFAIPYTGRREGSQSPSEWLEDFLHVPVAYVILPLFALANTGIVVEADWSRNLLSANSLGIVLGLVAGKPLGIVLATFGAVLLSVCRLPAGLGWRHVIGAGLLGGIGFTMSIFITNLAFAGQPEIVNASKMSILVASLLSGTLGLAWLGMRGDVREVR